MKDNGITASTLEKILSEVTSANAEKKGRGTQQFFEACQRVESAGTRAFHKTTD